MRPVSRNVCPFRLLDVTYLAITLFSPLVCRPQALVLSPTRELASQTEKNIMALGEFMKVRAHCCIGGKSIGEQSRHTHTKHLAMFQAMVVSFFW